MFEYIFFIVTVTIFAVGLNIENKTTFTERLWPNKVTRCVVAVLNSSGTPDFYFVVVECSRQQYDNGEHYRAANAAAKSEGFKPLKTYDEHDATGKALCGLFRWKTATTVLA